jgi:hypothetical protein
VGWRREFWRQAALDLPGTYPAHREEIVVLHRMLERP